MINRKEFIRQSTIIAGALATIGAAPVVAQGVPTQATIPLIVELNRPYIEATFRRADGSTRKARLLIDTGGGGFILTEPLARDLGIGWGPTSREDGKDLASAKATPSVLVGDLPLRLNPDRVIVEVGSDNVLKKASGHAEGVLPGHVLSQYHVVFDYPNATFTMAQPGVLSPKGDMMPMPVGKRSGFPRIEIEVDGKRYGMLLDTGASFTMVSDALLQSWGTAHPDWRRYPGAYGDAATLGGTTLETMFLPHVTWGAIQLSDVGVVSQRTGTFESYMSQMMAAPIMGSLAGNVLKAFRVDLDYPNQKLYISSR